MNAMQCHPLCVKTIVFWMMWYCLCGCIGVIAWINWKPTSIFVIIKFSFLRADGRVEEKIRREQQSSDSSQRQLVLPKKCIFCNKVGKYSKANRTRKKLTLCQTFSVGDKVRQSALEKHNVQLISFSTEELIAKEAH